MLQTCGRIAARARVARAPPAPAATMARGFKGLKSFDQLEPAPTNMPLPDTKDDLREYNPGLASTYMNENLEFHEEYKKIVDDLESFLRPDVLPDEDGLLHTPEVKQLGDVLIGLNQIETAMLMRLYQHYTGIDDEAAKEFYAIAAMGGGGGGDGGAAAEEEVEAAPEQSEFDLVLAGFDAKSKVKVIKEVRAMTGLGLKEAKETVEGAPKILKKGISKEEAEELKEKLEGLGATIEIS